jgi:hypothetical protein
MAERIKRDLGQEIFIDEMKRAEARGGLPPATVTAQRFPVVQDDTFNPGMEVVQDPSGAGKTPKQVAKDLEARRRKNYQATQNLYEKPSFLSRGLDDLGLLGFAGNDSKPVLLKTAKFKGLELGGTPLLDGEKIIMAVGNGELQFQDPVQQREAIKLYSQLKKSPGFQDYYGRTSEEEIDRLEKEFPLVTEDKTLMENMRQK